MVQIYNKNRVIQDRYCQVLKTKKVRNSLSFTPFPMDVYRYLSILTLHLQSLHFVQNNGQNAISRHTSIFLLLRNSVHRKYIFK